MLASITPLGERARHRNWTITVSNYLLASVIGGAAVGATAGLVGDLLTDWLPLDSATRWAFMSVLGLTTLGLDVAVRPERLPTIHRQVNEDWLHRYRGWAYGAGFGVQLGIGVVTIVTSAATYFAIAIAAISTSPFYGAIIVGTFGFVRALPVFLWGRDIQDRESMAAVPRLLGRWNAPTRRLATALEAVISVLSVGLFLRGI